MAIFDKSIEDIKESNKLYREFEKKDKLFTSTNNFFISEDVDNFTHISGETNEESIQKIDNEYTLFYNVEYREKEVVKNQKKVQLFILEDYDCDIGENIIDAKKLIVENNLTINDNAKILNELYGFHNLQKKETKYLFKIRKNTFMNRQFNQSIVL